MRSTSPSPVIMNVASEHLAAIATSRCLHLILVLLLHLYVLLFRMSRPAGKCTLHKSQRCSGSFPSRNTTTLDTKGRNKKCSRSLPALYATTGHPGTIHLNSCSTLGKNTTYVVSPPLPHQPTSSGRCRYHDSSTCGT